MGKTVIKNNEGGAIKVKCPWCKRWPEVQTHGQGTYWAICITDGCPVNPITRAVDSPTGAIKLWNSVKL